MKLTCSIIDDEPLARDLLESYVEKTEGLTLKGKYSNATAAMLDIMNNAPDFVFLDIELQDLNGVEFSRVIGSRTKVVFTTAYEKYALESYKVNAADYLLKPISYTDFFGAVEKVKHLITKNVISENDSIFVRSEYKVLQIKLKDIIFVEGLKDYLKIYVEGQPNPILSLNTIKSMESALPQELFIRVHRSFIVNKEKIKIIERNRIVFGKNYIPISESYKEEFWEFINEKMP